MQNPFIHIKCKNEIDSNQINSTRKQKRNQREIWCSSRTNTQTHLFASTIEMKMHKIEYGETRCNQLIAAAKSRWHFAVLIIQQVANVVLNGYKRQNWGILSKCKLNLITLSVHAPCSWINLWFIFSIVFFVHFLGCAFERRVLSLHDLLQLE